MPERILRAPFPWFGGKSRVADVVWRAFGNVPNYVEPFAGSLAVLLGRPHEPKIETVNDVDCYLANFWRAVSFAPDETAAWCDWPVNEADLHARHRWLVGRAEFRARMKRDAEYFDAKVAGLWVWGLSQWIGGGWCSGADLSGRRPEVTDGGGGVHKRGHELVGKRPNARNGGQGVHARGIVEQLPSLQGSKGINASSRLPDLMGSAGVVNGQRGGRWADGAPVTVDGPPALEWFRALQARLRRVRVCCGDWARVLTNSVIGTTASRNSGMNPCGVFLDPPYSDEERAAGLYGVDDGSISQQVREWAITHGDDRDLRIALCGYAGEHEMPPTWTEHAWTATRGYSGEENDNRQRERIWFSPHCLPLVDRQTSLFGEAG